MILGREPAVFYAFVASVIQLLSAIGLNLSLEQQGALNAAVVLVAGCVVAWRVVAERGIALLAGAVKALIAVGLAFGWKLGADLQSSIMLFVTMGIAFWTRGQVVAPVLAEPVSGPIEHRIGG